MIRNFFKIAFRNIRKNKVFSFINIFGLAAGLSCFMLIGAFVFTELRFDKYPVDADHMYRVKVSLSGNGNVAVYPMVDVAVGEGIKKAFPEVRSFVRIAQSGPSFVKYKEQQFKEEHFAYADSNFFQIFSIPLLNGNTQTALIEPNSMVVSKNIAAKYFGNENPVGKSVSVGGNKLFKITGVFDKIPENSHFHFDAFLSMTTIPALQQTWSNIGYFTYLTLNKNADPKKLEAKFPELVAKYVVPEIQHDMGVSLAEAQKSVKTFLFTLDPITDIHLYSNTKYELEPNGDIQYIYIFTALAVFILLLACINFTNLSTASAVRRSREVGIRKVMGSLKKQLVYQFLTESVFVTLIAMVFSFVIIFFLLPYFNEVAGKNLSFTFFANYRSVILIIILCIAVGLIAGIYPAFFLSSFNTIKVLKGSSTQGSGKNILRSGLVVFQFFVSTTLIIATIIVYQQLHYMQNKKLGYNQEQVVFLPDGYLLGKNQLIFKQALLQDNRISSVSIGRSVPGSSDMNGTEIFGRNANGNGAQIHTNIYHIDVDFLATLGISITRGRNFSNEFLTDSSGVLINESAAEELGWGKEDPIGKTIVRSGQKEYKVIGVVKNFHYASVKQKIAPLMMLLGNNYGGIMIKIKTANTAGLLTDIRKQWDLLNPGGPMAYHFLDEKFASLYASEQKTGKIFTSFTVIAILIASLGLFGLAAFITEQRTKELGIRKVLGASAKSLLLLVTKDFLLLVSIAFLISAPLTWWAMQSWLRDFAYRINIQAWVFPLSGLLAITIALLTISFQAIKAAFANPVDSLRAE